MNGTIERLGPFNQDMPASWQCVVCLEPPKRGQVFRLVEVNDVVTVQHEFLADCGIPGDSENGAGVDRA